MTEFDDVIAGTVGGLAGGAVMTVFMTIGKQLGFVQRPLPEATERWMEDRAGVDVVARDSAEEMVASMAGHMAFSAAAGAGYGALRPHLDLPPVASGALYGLGVYALNLVGVGPSLGIVKEPWDQEPTKTGRQLMMHVVFGVTTALVTNEVRQRLRDESQSLPPAPADGDNESGGRG